MTVRGSTQLISRGQTGVKDSMHEFGSRNKDNEDTWAEA